MKPGDKTIANSSASSGVKRVRVRDPNEKARPVSKGNITPSLSLFISKIVTFQADAAGSSTEFRLPDMTLYQGVYVGQPPNRGIGVFIDRYVRKGACVGEYIGEVISEEMWLGRYGISGDAPIKTSTFAYNLGFGLWVDAGFKGNYLRFLNHSCAPNCKFLSYVIRGQIRIFLYAINDIRAVSIIIDQSVS